MHNQYQSHQSRSFSIRYAVVKSMSHLYIIKIIYREMKIFYRLFASFT